jgi:hypothetical protein
VTADLSKLASTRSLYTYNDASPSNKSNKLRNYYSVFTVNLLASRESLLSVAFHNECNLSPTFSSSGKASKLSSKGALIMRPNRHRFPLWGLLPLVLLLIGCGGGATDGSSASDTPAVPAARQYHTDQTTQQNSQHNWAMTGGTPYLVKTLSVTMAVKDTRQVAEALQAWISTTDPHAFSDGMNYQQVDTNTYNITMSFSVQASLYPQIESYLRDYAPQQKGQLLGFEESVQDVTNDYIDTQSQLKNLRGEQARLLDLMSRAQALNDVLAIEQKLTNVEGQIEQTEEHINDLNNQLQFYTITITLQPLTAPAPPPTTPSWNIGQIFHDAFATSLAFAQGLLTMLIWLLAFSIYIVPLLIIAWFVYRWRNHGRILPPSVPKA